jgi:hypothetical protein
LHVDAAFGLATVVVQPALVDACEAQLKTTASSMLLSKMGAPTVTPPVDTLAEPPLLHAGTR